MGVVSSTRPFGPEEAAPAELYVPLAQDPWGFAHVLLRSDRPAAAEATSELAATLDSEIDVPPPGPYVRYVADGYAPLRLQLVIVGVLAVVGMSLAALGLYALIACHVSTRRREIGIRMALGARGERVFSSVMRQGVALGAGGTLMGLAVWFGALPVVGKPVSGLDQSGRTVPVLVGVLVVAVSAVATSLPARQSVRVDPAITLRPE